MNYETIKNYLTNMGKDEFDAVTSLVLKEVFQLIPATIDGKGDGGNDVRVFQNTSNKSYIAVQKTVQNSGWQTKAYNDAMSAQKKLEGIDGFYFLTSRCHENTDIRKLEIRISNDLKKPVVCLGGKEIASLIIENELLYEIAEITKLPIDLSSIPRPDISLVKLHTYFAMSGDRKDIRKEIYETTILSQLHSIKEKITEDKLIAEVCHVLGLKELHRQEIKGRISSLLQKGKIKIEKGLISISDATSNELDIANGIFLKDIDNLKKMLKNTIQEYQGDILCENINALAILIAKCFVEQKFHDLNHYAGTSFLNFAEFNMITSKSKLSDLLLKSKIPDDKIDKVLAEIIDMASGNVLIKKLINAIIYTAIENVSSKKSHLIFGQYRWNNIKVLLDTSVAIPFLLSHMFASTHGRFSKASSDVVNHLQKLGCKIILPDIYLEECAYHLLKAKDDCAIPSSFAKELSCSKNGYVSQYYQLKVIDSKDIPDSLNQFLSALSNKLFDNTIDGKELINEVKRNLRYLFEYINVSIENIKTNIEDNWIKKIQENISYNEYELKIKKEPILMNHDLNILAHIRNSQEAIILASWDRLLIQWGKELIEQSILIASPIEISDIVIGTSEISDDKLSALAYKYAICNDKPLMLGANFLETLERKAKNPEVLWKDLDQIKSLKQEFIDSIDLTHIDIEDIDYSDEILVFLKKKEIAVNEKDSLKNV